MGKRFRDTNIWDKEWYMILPCRLKCLVDFVRDKCDVSGAWSPNWVIANAYINPEKVLTEDDLLSIDDGNQFRKLPNGKIFCIGFVEFQYVTLSLESRVHLKVLEDAKRNGIYKDISPLIVVRSETIQAKRSRISDKVRKQIFAEDEYNCQYCGNHFSYDDLCIDHIVPLGNGGDNENENLTTSCRACNAKKLDYDVFEFIEQHNLTPLNSLSKKLNTLSKKLDSLKEKDKDKDKDKDKELGKETVKDSAEATGYTIPVKLPTKAPMVTSSTLVDAEHWTEQVIQNNDALFNNLLRNNGVSPGDHLENFARDHLSLSSRYNWHENWKTQSDFRYSLLKHIKDELKKQVNGNKGSTTAKAPAASARVQTGKGFRDT